MYIYHFILHYVTSYFPRTTVFLKNQASFMIVMLRNITKVTDDDGFCSTMKLKPLEILSF